jgi:hypothetical protein
VNDNADCHFCKKNTYAQKILSQTGNKIEQGKRLDESFPGKGFPKDGKENKNRKQSRSIVQTLIEKHKNYQLRRNKPTN